QGSAGQHGRARRGAHAADRALFSGPQNLRTRTRRNRSATCMPLDRRRPLEGGRRRPLASCPRQGVERRSGVAPAIDGGYRFASAGGEAGDVRSGAGRWARKRHRPSFMRNLSRAAEDHDMRLTRFLTAVGLLLLLPAVAQTAALPKPPSPTAAILAAETLVDIN